MHPSSVHILIGQYDPKKLSQVSKYAPPRAICSNEVQKLLRVLIIRVQMDASVSVCRWKVVDPTSFETGKNGRYGTRFREKCKPCATNKWRRRPWWSRLLGIPGKGDILLVLTRCCLCSGVLLKQPMLFQLKASDHSHKTGILQSVKDIGGEHRDRRLWARLPTANKKR